MRAVLSDVRYACRALAATPAFTAVAVLILAVGIGLNTAVFSLINMVLLRPLHGESQPGQLAAVYANDRTRPDSYHALSYPAYVDIRDRNQVFARTAGLAVTMVGLGEGEMTRRAFAFVATSTLFPLFDVRPTMGRGFLPEEETPGANRLVTIVSDEYWRRTGADPDIVGKTIRINTQLFTVIGVAPRGFGGPTTLITPAVWLPTGVYDLVAGDTFGQRDSQGVFADRAENSLLLFVPDEARRIARLGPGPARPRWRVNSRRRFRPSIGHLGLEVRPISRTGIGDGPQNDGDAYAMSGLLQGMTVDRAGHRLHESGEHAAGPLDQPAPRDRRALRAGRQPVGRRSATADGGVRPLDRRQRRRPACSPTGRSAPSPRRSSRCPNCR